jgi:hypothetical protein
MLHRSAFVSFILVLLWVFSFRVVCAQTSETPKRQNLGPSVNTAAIELSPVISPDGKTLYFVRSGSPENVGGVNDEDIWSSTLKDDGTWSPAIHLPAPLNDSGYNIIGSAERLPDRWLARAGFFVFTSNAHGLEFSTKDRGPKLL